ncbi:MAG: HD domain-containing protein [Burkholderiaceae bacterium]
MNDDDLVTRARRFAEQAHNAIDHRRKYSGRLYTEHLERVAARVAEVTDDRAAIAAAWLHDVVEDTAATHADIAREFGPRVAELVHAMTDIEKEHGNRASRKAVDRARLAQAPAAAHTVKLADVMDNAEDIAENDPHFARVFLDEMGALLEVLTRGEPGLLAQARAMHARLAPRRQGPPRRG